MSSSLSARLRSLASLIGEGRRADVLWDIGCDHGQLGLHAAQCYPWIRELRLVDPSALVIDQLRVTVNAHIPKLACKIVIEQKNGQDLQAASSSNIFVMAGMGGKTIREILTHLREQGSAEDRFVISPNRDIQTLRRHLREHAWGLESERLIEDNGFYYQQLVLTKAPRGREVSLYGEDFWQNTLGERYRAHLLEKLAVHRDEATQEFMRFLRS